MATPDVQHPWACTFGILGNIATLLVYFAPLPTFIRIYREKSTLALQSLLPYDVPLLAAMLWIYYALLKSNAFLRISINSFGCVIETSYIFIFLLYAPRKIRNKAVMLVSTLNVGVFLMILLLTYYLLEGHTRLAVVGWIAVVVSVCGFAAPLKIVFEVIRIKSAEFMSLSFSFCFTSGAILWVCYAVLQKDLYVALPNALGSCIGMLQLLLYGFYRIPKKGAVEEKKLSEHVINIANSETSVVHPVQDSPECGNSDDEVDYGEEESNEEKKSKVEQIEEDDSKALMYED